jgi:transcriptional regulator with GAF, ATPase, and Fis domain
VVDAIELDAADGPAGLGIEPTHDGLASQVAHSQVSLHDAVEALKRDAVEAALEETGGNWAEAARRLGMNRSNLHHMAQRLGIARR